MPQVHLRLVVYIALIFLSYLSFGQDLDYTRKCVQELASPNFFGRGFVKKGEQKAAKYIANELSKWKTKPFGTSYYQNYTFDINTVLKSELKTDKQTLKLGVDYIIFPASSSLKGRFDLYRPKNFKWTDFLKEDHQNQIFVLDTIHYKPSDLTHHYQDIIKLCSFSKIKGVIEINAQRLIQTQATYELGFPYFQVKSDVWDTTATSVNINLKTKLKKDYPSQNVLAYIEGEIDSFFVFTAHYDHLGGIGNKVYFPGANDNASGVATVLDLAKHYATKGTKPKYSVAFLFPGAEEVGLIGSKYYTEHPLFPLEKIKFVLNLDIVGTGSEGIAIVNGKANPKAVELLKSINKEDNLFPHIQVRGEAANSDHHFFHQAGVPAVFFYTKGGPQFYHDIYDRAETLPLTKHNELVQLLIEFTKRYE